jgi:predicted nucleotidyltransferase
MRIARKERIAETPILKIRDFFVYLNRHHTETFTLNKMCDYFKINEAKANTILNELIEKEYIVSDDDSYELTLKGAALRNARCVTPIDRTKADKIMEDFLHRVDEINKSDYYLYRVSKILLFGSYLNAEAVDFGDIDIAFELKRKNEDPDEFLKLNFEFIDNAKDEGICFSSFIEELYYSRSIVLKKLKNRSRYISLHEMSDEILERTLTKQIYPIV